MSTDTAKDTKRWRDDFIVRLRMKNVSGAQVADALKVVDAHCAETGETPIEAFGVAREYADSLGLARATPLSTYLLVIPSFLGAVFIADGLPALIRGERVDFTWADGVTWLILLAGAAALALVLGRARRPGRFAWLIIAGVLVASMSLGIVGRDADAWVSANAWLVVIAGVVLIAGVALTLGREIRSNALVDPITGEDMLAPESRWVMPVAIGLPLVMLVLIVVLALLTD